MTNTSIFRGLSVRHRIAVWVALLALAVVLSLMATARPAGMPTEAPMTPATASDPVIAQVEP